MSATNDMITYTELIDRATQAFKIGVSNLPNVESHGYIHVQVPGNVSEPHNIALVVGSLIMPSGRQILVAAFSDPTDVSTLEVWTAHASNAGGESELTPYRASPLGRIEILKVYQTLASEKMMLYQNRELMAFWGFMLARKHHLSKRARDSTLFETKFRRCG
jgi:hypothetical protein